MLNGVFRNPTTIIFGKGAEDSLPAEIRRFAAKILLVHGKQSYEKNGLSTKIGSILGSSGIESVELGGVQSSPLASDVYRGIEICRRKSINFILAVGGGSVIDTAKAVGIGVPRDGDFTDFFLKKRKPEQSLPVGVVLTLPGTGSESSDAAVITFDKTGEKLDCSSPLMFPVFAMLNPELSMTAPTYNRACGIVDAISHVFERYFSNTPFVDCSDQICEGLLRTLIRYGPLLVKDPHNYDYSAEVMWACKLAHDNTAGFGRKQDWGCHKICHEIESRHAVAHGAALAIVFPAWMKRVCDSNERLFLQLAERVFQIKPGRGDGKESISEAIGRYRSVLSSMGMPATLREISFTDRNCFQEMADRCVAPMPSGTIGNFKRLDSQDIIAILNDCF